MWALLCLCAVGVAGASVREAPGWHADRVHIPAHKRVIGLPKNAVVYGGDGEGPQYVADIPEFWMGAYEVSVARFAEFVQDMAHTTAAESDGGSLVLADGGGRGGMLKDAWVHDETASWRAPAGALGGEAPAGDAGAHPVVHVSLGDAMAFCAWDGGAVPTEEYWEAAAAGPKQGRKFPWGNVWRQPGGAFRANTWQGAFPATNTVADGWAGTAPVDAGGAQNDWGVHAAVGNVAEWTVSRWCDLAAVARRPVDDEACNLNMMFQAQALSGDGEHSVRREDMATGTDVVLKGGSFASAKNHGHRARVAARRPQDAAVTAADVGFRCMYRESGAEEEEGGGQRNMPAASPPKLSLAAELVDAVATGKELPERVLAAQREAQVVAAQEEEAEAKEAGGGETPALPDGGAAEVTSGGALGGAVEE